MSLRAWGRRSPAGTADCGVGCLCAQVFDLEFEPAFEFVGGDWDSWEAADRQLNHGPSLGGDRPSGNGYQRASRQGPEAPGRSEWSFRPIGARVPSGQSGSMRRNPFLDFQLTAERAGYPALLFVSLLCLVLVLVPFVLLALTQAVWVLVLALLSLSGAVAILVAGIGASFADGGDADLEPRKPLPRNTRRSRTFGETSSRPRRTGATGKPPSHAHGEDARR